MPTTPIPHAAGIGPFNRVPSGPRGQRPAGWIPARGVARAVKRMCHPQPRGINQQTASGTE